MATARCCVKACSLNLSDASDTATTNCGHVYYTGCLRSMLDQSANCARCGHTIECWDRSWSGNATSGGITVSRTYNTHHTARLATPAPGLRAFINATDKPAGEAYVAAAWRTHGGNVVHIEQAVGGGEPEDDVNTFMTALAAVLRNALLTPDAEMKALPVVDFNGFVDRALDDKSAMASFFRVLGEPSAGVDYDAGTWARETGASGLRRHAVGSYVALEILRAQVNRERRHPLHNWMAQQLQAHAAPDTVARLLVKLGVAAASAVDVTLHPGAEFDARQVTLARAYDDTLSLKLLDYDNIGFTKKGKKVGYEQFIALAFKQ